jgi:hypothetical protein
MKKNNNAFFETFAGEFVEIILDLQITNSVNLDGEGNVHEMQMPLTLQGFVMDADDQFVYLSPDGENINQAFPIKDLKHIAIVDVANPLQELLDEIPEPENDKGYN